MSLFTAHFHEKLKRGEYHVQSWGLLFGIDRLTGHGPISAFVKATICWLGGSTYYQPRWWQRYI